MQGRTWCTAHTVHLPPGALLTWRTVRGTIGPSPLPLPHLPHRCDVSVVDLTVTRITIYGRCDVSVVDLTVTLNKGASYADICAKVRSHAYYVL